jgi:hypothetical protein
LKSAASIREGPRPEPLELASRRESTLTEKFDRYFPEEPLLLDRAFGF